MSADGSMRSKFSLSCSVYLLSESVQVKNCRSESYVVCCNWDVETSLVLWSAGFLSVMT